MVIGVRAFNVRTDLVSQLPALFAYVEAGGNVIEQYNRPGRDLKTDQLTPYSLHLSSDGEQTRFKFNVTAHAHPTTAEIAAVAEINGTRYSNERVVINYPHIPLLLLQPPARLKAVCLNLAIRGHNVGYLPGAGDSVAQSLEEMGYQVTTLTGADLTPEKLKAFDAVVIGVRAFNVRTDLVSHLPALFAYVEAGGNVIEQYNRPGRDLKTDQLTPYSLRLSTIA